MRLNRSESMLHRLLGNTSDILQWLDNYPPLKKNGATMTDSTFVRGGEHGGSNL
jgi:hypothetical protein